MAFDSSDSLGQAVGAQLRAARLAKKYTQHQLAQPDFSVSYISAIERGQIQPSLRALEILSQRLGIHSTLLLSEQESHGSRAAVLVEKADEATWLLLEARLALHQRRPAEVIEMLSPLLARGGAPRQQVAIRYLLGRAYLDSHLLQESEAILAEAARMAQADLLYPRILARQGDVYAAMGQLEQAAHCQQASLDALQKLPDAAHDIMLQARVCANLGRTCSRLGAFERATALFQEALALLYSQPSLQQMDHHLARFYQGQGELLQASFFWQKCLQRAQQQQRILVRREIQHALGHALMQSQGEEAVAALRDLLQQASSQRDPLLQASARVHLASWSLAHDDLDQAAILVHEALELARPHGESQILAAALLVQARLSYAQKNYEQGDESFQDGLALLEHLQAVDELLVNLTVYARLLEERGLPHQALHIWKRAYEIRQP